MDRGRPSQITPSHDVSTAEWLMERLWKWHREDHPPVRVGSFVPTGFEAYARIFHPAWVDTGRTTTRWSDLAERNGRAMHPEIAFWELVRPADASPDWRIVDPNDVGAEDGSLPEELCVRLADVLSPFTSTPERCWFAVWEGWGDLPPELERLPKARAPSRAYVLFSGPVTAVGSLRWSSSSQSPSLWWPDDRAWCVSTEIEDYSMFVAGSDECIEAVLQEPALEAMRTWIGARGDFGPYRPRDE